MVLFYVLKESVVSFLVEVRRKDSLYSAQLLPATAPPLLIASLALRKPPVQKFVAPAADPPPKLTTDTNSAYNHATWPDAPQNRHANSAD